MSDEKPAGVQPVEDDAVLLQRLEDEALTLWHKLESRKLDLVLMANEGPRSLFIRDEAKAILSQYVEVQKKRMKLVRGRVAAGPEPLIFELPQGEPKTVVAVTVSMPTDRPPSE